MQGRRTTRPILAVAVAALAAQPVACRPDGLSGDGVRPAPLKRAAKPAAPVSNASSASTGRLKITIAWPVGPGRDLQGYRAQLIPDSAARVDLTVKKGDTTVGSAVATRKAGVASTSVALEVPCGTLSIAAEAFPADPHASTPIARGTASGIVVDGTGETVAPITMATLFTPSITGISPVEAATGSTLTLSGAMLAAPWARMPRVVFHGGSASASGQVLTAGADMLTVQIPDGARTGRLEIEVDGVRSLSTAMFRLAPPPLRLRRGINIGNGFDAPSYGYYGWTVSEADIEAIAAEGFDTLRLPVRWSAHAAAAPPYTIDPTFLGRVDAIVTKALSLGMDVVLDFHSFRDLIDDPASRSDRFVGIWTQLATHYRGFPLSLHLELLNEPGGGLTATIWDALAKRALAAIRAIDPDRWVVMSGLNWTPTGRLPVPVIPDGDDRTIGTFHLYVPMHFTHQGATWVNAAYRTAGVTWPGPPAVAVTPVPEAAAVAGAANWFHDYSTLRQEFNPAGPWHVREVVEHGKRWADRTGRRVWLGEFGAIHYGDVASRARWLAHVRDQAERNGIGWAVWDDRSEFAVFDRNTRTWPAGFRDALLPPSGATPVPQATPAPGPAAPDLPIWNGGLQPGWTYQSWRGHLGTCAQAQAGDPCAVGYTGNEAWWGYRLLNNTGQDTTGYDGLTLEVRASGQDQELAVQLIDMAWSYIGTRVSLFNYGGTPPAGAWKRYYVPLNALGGRDRVIRGVAVVDAGGSAQPEFLTDRLGLAVAP